MNTIFVHRDGRTEQVTSIDRSWLGPAGGVYLWVDLSAPSIPESLVLTDTFAFHRLAVDDAMAESQSPKIEAYDGYLFASMAGGDADVACFVGAHYLVSVHWRDSQAIADMMDSVRHGAKMFADGPVAMFHRLLDGATSSLKPAIEKLTGWTNALERRLLEKATADLVAETLDARRDAFALTQRVTRQREALDRLVRHEVVDVSAEMAFRFRHVRDRLIRFSDDSHALDHRLAGLLTAAAALAGGRRWM
ncbi:MAG TPA: CorA family divalent cation transporter [Vicinamibacterales bacterium]|nr:CorA family divalent cation transporter [Vicinamibacterales bacterium]